MRLGTPFVGLRISVVRLLTSFPIVDKNPKTKPGFKELGSVTPYDLAVRKNDTKVAAILQPFQHLKLLTSRIQHLKLLT